MGLLNAIVGLFQGIACAFFDPSLNEFDYDIFYLSQVRRQDELIAEEEEYFGEWDCDDQDEDTDIWWK